MHQVHQEGIPNWQNYFETTEMIRNWKFYMRMKRNLESTIR